MLGQTDTTERRFHGSGPQFLQSYGAGHDLKKAGLYREHNWRRFRDIDPEAAAQTDILLSRWQDDRTSFRREQAEAPTDRYVVSIALRPTRLRLIRGPLTLFEGTMPTGMLHVTGPAQPLQAEFQTPCDFIHLHVAADYLHSRQVAALADPSQPRPDLRDFMIRDSLAAQLAQTLTESRGIGAHYYKKDGRYEESVGQTIVMRLLALRPSPPGVGALAKWRLRRIQEHVNANIGDPITLADLAAAAGLSRMHFAAQFRAAMGCRPHEYLLQQRIECAKATLSSVSLPLAEVALSVGFQTQSHFSTVFKRLTGETPARWQRANRRTGSPCGPGRPL